MSIAEIPPLGQIKTSLERQKRRIRENNTTLDPTERYKLREERISEDLAEATANLIRESRIRESKWRIYPNEHERISKSI